MSSEKKAIVRSYREHPLRAETILARVKAQGLERPLEEPDLAVDPEMGITDQNHPGGAAFVVELAERAEVTADTDVLDLGAGLGGSARYLAWKLGCRVVGVDVSPDRVRDARVLTRLVGLEDRVSFRCADFRDLDPEPASADVVWGQAAWAHAPDREALLELAAESLRPDGRVAVEDVYERRVARDGWEEEAWGRLLDAWNVHRATRDDWLTACRAAGLVVTRVEDLTDALVPHFHSELALAERLGSELFPEAESRSAERALELTRSGVLGYVRVVARRR